MSYDLQVWTTLRPEPGVLLLPGESWRREDRAFCKAGKGWQVLVSEPGSVEAEDVPDQVAVSLPGIRFLTTITVEPISAPRSALALARKVATRIAKQAHGIFHDQQDGSVVSVAGVKRFLPHPRPDRFSVIEMSWWFVNGPLATHPGLERFVDLLVAHLPEALPRRYGLFEPPQHRLAEEGVPHFRQFLEAHRGELVVWYPSRPVVGVGLTLRSSAPPQLGFRCHHLDVTVELAALAQPGWQAGLQSFWRRASMLVRPFYGDVRTLGGLIRSGGTYAIDINTEFGPTRGPFWRGIPRDPGHACVLGPEYVGTWPGFREQGETADGLAFLCCERWDAPTSVVDLAGPVPDSVAHRHAPKWTKQPTGGLAVNWNTEYPEIWPLGERPPPDPGW